MKQRGRESEYVMLPPGRKDKVPEGAVAVLVYDVQGYTL